MDLRHVRTFLVVAEELHFGRAAARLHVVQSGVSQTIKALEQEMGVTLFARTQRRVALTAAGERFIPHARQALASLAHGAEDALRAASGEVGSLRLRFTPMSSLTVLPQVLQQLQRRVPGVDLQIEPGGGREILEAVMQGRCDIGVVPARNDVKPLAREDLERAPLVAIVPTAHPLAHTTHVTMSELAAWPLILPRRDQEPQIRDRLRRLLDPRGREPQVAFEVDQPDSLLTFIAAGLGVSVAPSYIRRLRVRGVTLVPVRPVIRGGAIVVWNPRSLSPTAERFLELMRHERDQQSARSRPR